MHPEKADKQMKPVDLQTVPSNKVVAAVIRSLLEKSQEFPRSSLTLSPLVLLSLGMAGCASWGGGSSEGSSFTVAPGAPVGAGGLVADGYLRGATVFRDANNNNKLDAGEVSVTTDAQGKFVGLGGTTGNIVATGGTDISTGKAFAGLLSAPTGSAVVNPLTTLVSAAMGSGLTQTQAETQVASALGISTATLGGSLTQVDPIALSADATKGVAALTAQKAAAQAANVLVAVTEAVKSSGAAANFDAAADLATKALGSVFKDAGGAAVNLSDTATIQAVFTKVAADPNAVAGGLVKLAAVDGSASQAIASVNNAIGNITVAAGATPAQVNAALAQVVQTQLVVMDSSGGLVKDIGTAAAAGGTVNTTAYEGTALATAIDSQADNIQDLLGTASATAPKITLVTDSRLANDQTTNVTVEVASTTGAKAGDRVQLLIDGKVVTAAVADIANAPTATTPVSVTIALSENDFGGDATHLITARIDAKTGSGTTATFTAGTASSSPAVVVVDTTAAAPAVALGTDTGSSATDAITKTATLNVTGLETGATWQYSTDGGTTYTTGSGTSVTLTGDGAKSVLVRQTDAAGNVSAASAALAFTLDSTAPSAPFVAVAAGAALATSAEAQAGAVRVEAESGASVAVTFTNGTASVTKTVTGTGVATPANVTLTAADVTTLGNGTINVSAVATDAAGNVGSAGTGSFVLDTVAPVAPTVTLVSGLAAVSAESGASVAVTFTQGTASVTKTVTGTGAADTVSLTAADRAALGDGTINISAVATDAAGNVGSAGTASFLLDSTPPAAPVVASTTALTEPGAATVSAESGSTVQVTFTRGTASVVKTVTGTGTALAVDLAVADRTTLGDGIVTVSAVATDAAGNSSTAGTAEFLLDATAPAAPTLALATNSGSTSDSLTNSGVVNVTGLETGATWQYSTDGGTSYTTGSGTSLTLTGDGDHSVQVRQTDTSGNVGSASTAFAFTLDATVPAAPVVATVDATGVVTLSGVETGASAEFSYNGAAFSTTQTPATGTLQVHQIDAAGNTGAATSVNYMLGTAGADTLAGTSGTDIIVALAGNDAATGGGGADLIHLGDGTDTVKFAAATDSSASAMDHVFGFGAGDKIDLSAILGAAGIGYNGENAVPAGSASSPFELRNAAIANNVATVDVFYVGTALTEGSASLDFLTSSAVTGVTLTNSASGWFFDVNPATGVVGGIGTGAVASGARLVTVSFDLAAGTTQFVIAVENNGALLNDAAVATPVTKVVGGTSTAVSDKYAVVDDGATLGTVGDNEIHFAQKTDGTVSIQYDTNKAAGTTSASDIIQASFDSLAIDLTKTDFIYT